MATTTPDTAPEGTLPTGVPVGQIPPPPAPAAEPARPQSDEGRSSRSWAGLLLTVALLSLAAAFGVRELARRRKRDSGLSGKVRKLPGLG
jgi:hypothetical protein